MPYYAVAQGYQPGIYRYWEDCQEQICGYSDSDYRKFHCHADARHYLRRQGLSAYDYQDYCGIHSEDEEENDVYYAVSTGRRPGIYTSLFHCKKQVDGYSEAEFRKFNCRKDAQHFMRRRGITNFCTQQSHEKLDFILDGRQRVKIYVDGACSRNGEPDATAGIGVWFGDNHQYNVSKPIRGKKLTNIIAEIEAVIEACRIARKHNLGKITICTDSKYVTNCVLKHIDTWIARGWRNSSGREVGNRKILEKLENAWDGLDVVFESVEAHTGMYGNEQADYLARHAAGEF